MSASVAADDPWASESELVRRWRESGCPLVVLGLDGGATSTECAVLAVDPLSRDPASAQPGVLGEGRGGSSNHNSVGEDSARAAVREAISAALIDAQVPAQAVLALAACMAGVDRPADKTRVHAWLRVWFPHPVALVVHNDAVAALASGTRGWVPGLDPPTPTLPAGAAGGVPCAALAGPQPVPRSAGVESEPGAIVVIAGTGTIVYGFSADGRSARAAGAGPLLGDRGSGYAIASEALAAVMRAWDGRGSATSLSGAVVAHLGLEDPNDLIGWMYADVAWARVAALLPLVKQCAAQGDAVALRILNDAAAELARGIRAVALRLGMLGQGEGGGDAATGGTGAGAGRALHCSVSPPRGPVVVAAGGVLQDRTGFDISALLRRRLQEEVPGCRLQEPQVGAAVAAALFALRGVTHLAP